ncbi:WD40 repeat-containing protein [Mycoavidus cysteinexigens]|uniref:WD40 repeat-containing protein n=1 Tax=Mycoavidus cysteinexigens TaxID=1553431 RepID=A0A2Z6ET48_9BURK|nr:NACHT domain-containing protein [Mycoavidus cysteinexigens]BBE08560.1 WD40 repeat-containing protein [Mycoavidus cysteinexigens]GLR00411.1 hypothetical protein GCM10007934_02220 [Mycoavidus cysteinexigens]
MSTHSPALYTLVGPDEIKDTRHLAWCLQQAPLGEEHLNLQRQLYLLAREVIERFGKRAGKDWECIREAIALSVVPHVDSYKSLIFHAVGGLSAEKQLPLNMPLAQGLALMVRQCPPSLLKKEGGISSDTWTSILNVLLERLKIVHKGDTQHVHQLLQTISQLLDAMVQAGVAGINRTRLQKPLYDLLRDEEILNPNKDLELTWQIRYAREALAHIPNDESRKDAVLRCLFSGSMGVLGLASAIKSCDVDKLLESFNRFEEAFSGAREVANVVGAIGGLKEVLKNATEAKESFEEMRTSLQDRDKSENCQKEKGWYMALQLIDQLIEANQLVEFEQFVRGNEKIIHLQNPYRQNPIFLQGVCQRLEWIVCTQEDELIQEQAIQFLKSLAEDTAYWMGPKAKTEVVKWKAKSTLDRLERRSAQILAPDDNYAPPPWDPVWKNELSTQLLLKARSESTSMRRLIMPQQDLLSLQNSAPLADLDIQKLQDTYLDTLEKDTEIKDALAMYIAPECTLLKNTSERFDLGEKVKEFLASEEKQVLLLLGEAGSGKSTFNRYLARSLWEEYSKNAGTSPSRIPLFIPLWSLNNPGANLIVEYLKKEGFSEKEISELKKNHQFIFILDGYDEIEDRAQMFYAKNELDKWKAKVIIASRSEYLGENYRSIFHPLNRPQVLQEYRLTPLSEKSIEGYINKYVVSKLSEVDQIQLKSQLVTYIEEDSKRTKEHEEILEKAIKNHQEAKRKNEEIQEISEENLEERQKLEEEVQRYQQEVDDMIKMVKKRIDKEKRFKAEILKLSKGPNSIYDYVEIYLAEESSGWNAIKYKSALKQFNLTALVDNPFLLRIALEILPTLDKEDQSATSKQRSTRVTLYDQFVQNWFERSDDRLKLIQLTKDERKAFNRLSEEGFTAHGIRFSQNLALAMYESQKVVVTYSEASPPWSQDREPFLNNDSEKMRLLRFSTPLSRQGNQYRFIHKTLRDYFVARALWEELGAHDKVKPSSWFNRLNLLSDPAILQFMVERVQQNAELKGELLRVVKRSEKESKLEKGAVNAMTLLVRAGVQFNGADLKGIRIPGADLSNGVFDAAQLQRADLTNVNLCNSWLRGANLDGAQMEGVQFGEWPFLQEESEVFCCAYSPDGETFALGLKNHGINVYTTSNWKNLWTLQAHNEAVTKVVYSPKKGQLASSSWDKTVRLWDITTGSALQILSGHKVAVYSIAYSPNGNQIASGSGDATVRIWDVETGALLCALSGHGNLVSSVAYSPKKEKQLASSSHDKTVRIWDGETGVMLQNLRGHSKEVSRISYSPTGVQLASCSDDGTVRLWDVETGTCQYTFNLSNHGDPIWSIAYSPCGTELASGSGTGIVYLLDVETSFCRQILKGHLGGIYSVMYSPNGAQLASVGPDKTVRLWDVKIGSFCAPSSYSHNNFVHSVEYSLDGNQIASGSLDQTIRLWDMATGTCRHTFIGHTGEVRSLAYSPKSDQLASGSVDKTVRLWDIETGAIRHTLTGHTGWIRSIAYSPTGDQIASGGQDTTVRLWDVKSGFISRILRGHKDSITSITYSPDGAQLASSNEDETIRLWDARSGIFIHDLIGHTGPVNSVMYSLSGTQLASGGDDHTIRLWDLKTAACSRILNGHCDEVWVVKYSPEGTQLVSGSRDHTVRLWDVKTGLCQMVLQGFNGPVASVAWKMISNSLYLATGSHDHSVRQWQIIREEVRYKALLCWSSENNMLTAFDTSIQSVQGLSQLNQRLLEQRGAVSSDCEKSE